MVRATGAHLNFSSGELSPRMRGRIDLPLYQNGLERCENFIVETQGPARFRNGFEFMDYSRDLYPSYSGTSSSKIKLVTFTFNDEQSHVLCFTDQYMSVYSEGGPSLGASQDITGITNGSTTTITFAASPYAVAGSFVFITGVEGMEEINSTRPFYVISVSGTSIVINANSTTWGTYTSGGKVQQHNGVVTPYSSNDIAELKFAQKSDTMYITHKLYEPRKLTRVGAGLFTLSTFSRTADPFGSYANYPGAVTFYEQRAYYGGTTNNPQKVWASKAGDYDNFTMGTAASDAFVYDIATKKTNYIHWLEGNNQFLAVGSSGGNLKMSGGGSADAITPTNVSVKPIDYFGSSQTSPALKDKRIIFVQNGDLKIRSLEYTIDADDYEPLDITKVADHIVTSGVKELVYTENNPDIVWVLKNNGELAGLTYDPVEKIFGWHRHKTDGKILSIASLPRAEGGEQLWIAVDRNLPDVSLDSSGDIILIEALGDAATFPRKADFYTGNKTEDEALFSNRLYYFQKRSNHLDSSLVYDGSFLGLYQTSLDLGSISVGAEYEESGITFVNVNATNSIFDSSWIGKEIRGDQYLQGSKSYADTVTDGRLEIYSIISSTVVKCKVLKSWVYVTGYGTAYCISTNKVSGLDHLIGETVDILADGSVHAQKVVNENGEITLDYQADYVIVGKAYSGTIVTNNIEVGGVTGIAQTKPKNIARIGMRFLDTLGVSYGYDPYRLETLNFRTTSSYTNRPPELFTGDKQVHFPDSWDREKKIIIRQDRQLPCTVQMLVPVVNTSDE